ncbi:MAG: hypothetical protein ABIY55_04235, partial [Kofleriaceae bacterium]
GKVAPDPALRVVGDAPATKAARPPTTRAARKMPGDLRVVGSDAPAPAAESTGSAQMLGNG